MRNFSWHMVLLMILTLLLTNCTSVAPATSTDESPALTSLEGRAAAPTSQEMGLSASTEQCVDFQSYPDNARVGQAFRVGGFGFNALGSAPLFVNDIAGGVHGLQFGPNGISVDLPVQSPQVSLTAGSYTSDPLMITALDSDGNTVTDATSPGDNSVHSLSLTSQAITSVVITGGGYEGVLVEICIGTGSESNEEETNEFPIPPGSPLTEENWLRVAKSADHVVVGTITDIHGYYGNNPFGFELILSDVSIEVSSVWSGKETDLLTFTMEGGTVEDMTLHVSNLPQLKTGESYIFLLSADEDSHLWLYGTNFGAQTLVDSRYIEALGSDLMKLGQEFRR